MRVCNKCQHVFLDGATKYVCFFSLPALNIVYQRNGDGEAKSPACRAGVCEAVLHTLKQGTRFPAQVITEM